MYSKKHVGFLNTHPIQYFAPFYAFLGSQGDFSVTALYLSDYSVRGATDRGFGQKVKWDIDLLHGYEARFLKNANVRSELSGFWSVVAPDLWNEVRASQFDALVLHGHSPAAMLIGLLAAKSVGIPVFMRCDTHLGLHRSGLKRALRSPILHILYSLTDGALAIGTKNRAFYRSMGMPEAKIFHVPYAVDYSRFELGRRIAATERRQLRRSLGIADEHPVILYVSKLNAGKRPTDLLRAAAAIAGEGVDFHVLFVGSGELEAELRTAAHQLGLHEMVHFPGFVNQGQLPNVYAACEVFVLPSENEAWGLVVNEAMCAGLPVVVSQEVGCVPDLVHDGINGRTFEAGDVVQLTAALKPLLESPELRRRMGGASRTIISRWSYAQGATGLRAALDAVGRVRRHQRSSSSG